MRALVFAAMLLAVPHPVAAEDAANVQAVLSALSSAPHQAGEYKASVALHVRMRVFPFIRVTLHGDSWYKRPGLYRFVFRGVPLIARAFSDMKYDLGDPAQWPERYDIALAPSSTADEPVLRLLPKAPVMVKSLEVAIDPVRGRILRATWSRADGGVITLVQTYEPLAGHEYVAKQVATINLPRMKAELEADYADFTTIEPSVGTAAP